MKAYREPAQTAGNLGIMVSLSSIKNAYIPAHWHEEVEILFCLNGEALIHVGRKKFMIKAKQIAVFDSGTVHSVRAKSSLYMFMSVRIDKKKLTSYFPGIVTYRLQCAPVPLDDEKSEAYINMCRLAQNLTEINIEEDPTSGMRSDGTVLMLMADMIRYCADLNKDYEEEKPVPGGEMIRRAVSYVNEHFREDISLADIAEVCGVSREHFCRVFKKNMEMTFLQYLDEVRVAEAALLLISTDDPISEIMEQSGFTNQTLFNRVFRQVYGMTPREVRKRGSLINDYNDQTAV